MRIPSTARLVEELARWADPWDSVEHRRHLVEISVPRIAQALELLPDAGPDARLLELGSAPYLASLAIDLVWPGRVTHANYFGTDETRGTQTLAARDGHGEKVYAYDLFNVEADEFPYPDASFDVVFFSELLEHLAVNPVWTLAEIHRVLRPGGHVVVTTPNGVSIERIAAILRAYPLPVDRYAPAFGYGARHNREYHPDEVRQLLEETGFDVEIARIADVKPRSWRRRLARTLLAGSLRFLADAPRGDHVFVRARRRDRFRWRFPPRLFANAEFVRIVRHPWVVMGLNDTIQCRGAWGEIEIGDDGVEARRVPTAAGPLPGASVVLRGDTTARSVSVRIRAVDGATRVRLTAHRPDDAPAVFGLVETSVAADRWTDVDVPVQTPIDGDGPLAVTIVALDGPTLVHAVRLVADTTSSAAGAAPGTGPSR